MTERIRRSGTALGFGPITEAGIAGIRSPVTASVAAGHRCRWMSITPRWKSTPTSSGDAGTLLAKLESRARPNLNLLINGDFPFFQRQTPATPTSRSDDTYGPDRWYVLTQTAAINVERSTGSNALYACKLTQPQVAAQRMGLAQIVEGINSYPMRSRSVRFQARIKCSSSQAIRCAIVEHIGTIDSVTSDIVNDWTSGNYTDGASKFFVDANLTPIATAAVTPGAGAWADISVTGTLDGSVNNLIVFVWTEGTAAQNVTLEITEAGLYDGTDARDWLPRPIAQEFVLCCRYYEKSYFETHVPGLITSVNRILNLCGTNCGAGASIYSSQPFKVRKRTTPSTVRVSDEAGNGGATAKITTRTGWACLYTQPYSWCCVSRYIY